VEVLLLSLIVLAGYKMKHRAQAAVARILFKSRYDMYDTLSTFSKALVSILDLKTLTEEIVRTLVNAMGIRAVALYLLDKEKGLYVPASSYGLKWEDVLAHPVTVADPLPRHVSKIQALVVREELEHVPGNEQLSPVVESLRALQADVCIPFINKNSLVGFCVLGPRTTDQMYSDQDLSLLMTLAQAAAIALDNAVLYEELKRSQTLVRRTDRLRSLETIAGGFAHEVRNPLTSIKTFIQLTPERKDDPEFIGHFSTVVAEDVARIERLIEEILDYARYMEPKFMEEDINDVVESCLYSVRIKADTKSVSLQKDLARNLPPVTLDRQQIKQVLLNLLLNAIEAMGPASGRLIVKTHRLTKSGGDSWVQVEVTDTGCGIAPGDLDHIFDPFYTTKHASDEREGTGIGLTIVHQIVQEHGGHITVDSKVGRGTTFLVNLPINPVPAHSTMGHARV
jgi:signal transduction histidine kinase